MLVVCSIDMKGLICLCREFLKMNVFLHARHKLQVTGNHVNFRPHSGASKRTGAQPFPPIKRGDHLRAQMSSLNTAFYCYDVTTCETSSQRTLGLPVVNPSSLNEASKRTY